MQKINFVPGRSANLSKYDPTLSDRVKNPSLNKRPTASVELLTKINQAWMEGGVSKLNMDFGPIEDQFTPEERSRQVSGNIQDKSNSKNDLTTSELTVVNKTQMHFNKKHEPQQDKVKRKESVESPTRKHHLLKNTDVEKPCRICSKMNKMTKMYYYDRAFFCEECYVTVSQRFKKINRCGNCKSDPDRVVVIKFIMANPFVKNEGSLLFTREKKVDLFYNYLNKYSGMVTKSFELNRALLLISNNLVTPISTFAEVKICSSCKPVLFKCAVCKYMSHKDEMFVVQKCSHAYCLDCLATIFLKKYNHKKEFTCKGSFCWSKTPLVNVLQFLTDKLSQIEAEYNFNTSKAA